MQVTSYIRHGSELIPVEIELSLVPGLPQIVFIGLPDAAMKESVLRIRTAIRAQGFKLPRAKQILVQLKPTHLRKSSRGLDLAVAAAFLWETEQVPRLSGPRPVLYGELSLSGHVETPDDAFEIETPSTVYTGLTDAALPFTHLPLRSLADLARPLVPVAALNSSHVQRPLPLASTFAAAAAELAVVIAAGEHSALIAGPQGSGKSTLAGSILAWVEAPQETGAMVRSARLEGRAETWRPIVRPHQSITPLAMIGGGSKPWAGEIHRAHGGVLLMDEFLGFHPEIQEALREPTETGHITIARGGQQKRFDARWLLLATTNLCRCGAFVPNAEDDRCRCSGRRRREYLSRLSGPFADRFSIIGFSDQWQNEKAAVSSDEIARRVEEAIQFRRERRAQTFANSWLPGVAIEESLTSLQRRAFLDDLQYGSLRRREAVLRIARTLADLRADLRVADEDLDEALRLSVRSHKLIETSV